MNYINNEIPTERIKLVCKLNKHYDVNVYIAPDKIQDFVTEHYMTAYDTIDAFTIEGQFIGSTEL